jgi:hypothetical protein
MRYSKSNLKPGRREDRQVKSEASNLNEWRIIFVCEEEAVMNHDCWQQSLVCW